MKTRLLIKEFIINCGGLKPRTIGWYENTLAHFAHYCPEFPLIPKPIEEFFYQFDPSNKKKSKYKKTPENRHQHYRAVRAFFNFALARNLIALYPESKKLLELGLPIKQIKAIYNPINQIPERTPKRKIPYSLILTEIAWLLAIPLLPRDKALITLILDTGVRIGEALGLCYCDIKTDTIIVDGKTGQREIPISQETRVFLFSLGSNGHIFKSSKGDIKYTWSL